MTGVILLSPTIKQGQQKPLDVDNRQSRLAVYPPRRLRAHVESKLPATGRSMSSFAISLIVFAVIFGGALLGFFLHTVLPERHLSPESRQTVVLGMGVIGTMSALVLGLLVASAKGTFDAQNSELMDASGKIIFLEDLLAEYGPDSKEARNALRSGVEETIDRLWPQERQKHPKIEGTHTLEVFFHQVQRLTPQDESQRTIKAQAMATAISLLQARSLAVAQQSVSTSMPLLITLVFWLAINFISLGLFAPRNGTVLVTLFLCALAVSGAILLILELSDPLGGLFRVSSAPLRAALAHLNR